MSLAEIVSELPKLSHAERRELARRLFDMTDDESSILTESDQRADERFKMLDQLEAEDGETATG